MRIRRNRARLLHKAGALLLTAALTASAFAKTSVYSAAEQAGVFSEVLEQAGTQDAMLLSASVVDAETENTAAFLYMALDGSDENPGTIEAPFATLNRAVEEARKIEGTVVINVRGGWYQMTETVKLTEEDSDLVIRSYPGEKAVFGGGVEVPLADMEYVTDEEILNRIVDEEARKHIRHVNLSKYGLDYFGEMRVNGAGFNSYHNGYASQLTYKGEYLTIAQYPNGEGYDPDGNERSDTYLLGKEVLSNSSTGIAPLGTMKRTEFTLQDFDRYQYWEQAEDIWVRGYLCFRWANSIAPAQVGSDGVVYTYWGSYTPLASSLEVKFLHLLEELDVPGEFYVDFETGDLYVYAPEGMSEEEVFEYTVFDQSFIQAENVSNIVVEDLRITGTRTTAFNVKNSDGFVINSCEISNTGDSVATFSQCFRCGVSNSYLHDLGGSGVLFRLCGSRQDLVHGECFVTNCEIAKYSRYLRTSTPAVEFSDSFGGTISHNLIYDSTNQGITFHYCCEMLIEYNDISNVCTYTWDNAAIYSVGRCWSALGNVVRYNYLHDIVRNVTALYYDDQCSGVTSYGNVFYNLGNTMACNGGKNITFTQNLIIDCGGYWGSLTHSTRGFAHVWNAFWYGGVDWQSDERWFERYPELTEICERHEELCLPYNAVYTDNFIYNTIDFSLGDDTVALAKAYENNVHLDCDSISFTDFCGGDYSVIQEFIPGFDMSQWDSIGLEDYTYEDNWVETAAVYKDPEAETPDEPDPPVTPDEPDTPADPYAAYVWELEELCKRGSALGIRKHEIVEDYVHLEAWTSGEVYTVDDFNSAPQFYIQSAITGDRYVAIKYRCENAENLLLKFYMASTGSASDDNLFQQSLISDGEWHLAIFDTQELIDAGLYDGSKVSFFQFRPLSRQYARDENGEILKNDARVYLYHEIPEDAYLDVAYIGFFATEEAAKEYDANRKAE